MASLFAGEPLKAPSYAATTSDVPQWLQDYTVDLFSQQRAVAATPYQPYTLPRIAETTAPTTAAQNLITSSSGAYQPTMQGAITGTQGLTGQQAGTTTGLNMLSNAAGYNAVSAAQPYTTQAGTTTGAALNVNAANAASPYLTASAAQNIVGAGSPYFGTAGNLNAVSAASPYLGAAGSLNAYTAAQPYATQAAAANPYDAASNAIAGSLKEDITNAANPYLSQAGSLNAISAASPYLGAAANQNIMAAASPYLTQAAKSSVSDISSYMNPYNQAVTDQIAKLGARNLTENLLPGVSDQFIRAGSFGGSRMGEFGSRALRDTQESILNQQGQALQQGYTQALSASQADAARQAQLAQTAGGLSQAQAATLANIGQQAGQLTSQQAQNQATVGQAAGQLTQADAARMLAAGQAQGNLTAQQQQALMQLSQQAGNLTAQQQQNLANIGQTYGQLTGQQAQNLTNIGAQAGQLTQAQAAQLAALGQTTGNLTQAQQNAMLQAGQQFGTLGQQQGALTSQQAQNLANIGQQYGATSQAGTAQNLVALSQAAELAKQQQGMVTADAAALEAIGAAQQAQQQKGLDVAYQDFQNQINYPQQQINNMSTTLRGLPPTAVPTTGTQSGYTTTFTPSPLSQLASGFATYKGLTNVAKGGLIKGYAAGGAVTGGNLEQAVMADYGQYMQPGKYYNQTMASIQPALEQNKNAVANMAAYHAANPPIASPNTLPAMYKKYNELKSTLNPSAVNTARDSVQAAQDKYNAQYTALNEGAVNDARNAVNTMVTPYSDPETIRSTYNAGGYDVGLPKDISAAERRALVNQYVAAGYATVAGPDPTVWYMRPKTMPTTGMMPESKRAEYDSLLNNYNTLNSAYTTGLEKIAPQKTEYENLLAKYNTLNDAYSTGSAELTAQKAAYEKARKAGEIPSPFGTSMPHLAHGGRVPGYAQEGYVDVENPAELVDGGQAFADQYMQGQLEYPTQQDMPAPVARPSAVEESLAQRRAIMAELTKALSATPAASSGMTDAEKYFRLAAAFAKPGKTGSFGEGLGYAAETMADVVAEKRKEAKEQAALGLQRLQARSELANQQYALAREGEMQDLLKKYINKGQGVTDQVAAGATGAAGVDNIPQDIKELILAQPTDKAVTTIIEMAKEANKPSDLIKGVNFLVQNGSISKEEGAQIVKENLQGKLEQLDITVPELGGTVKLTGPEARQYYSDGTLPARLGGKPKTAPVNEAAPAPKAAAPVMTQEQIKAKETGMVEQSKKDIEASDLLLSQKSFAKQQKDAAREVLGFANKAPKAFGVIADPTWSNAVANLVETGVNTPWGSVGLAVEEPIAKLKLTGPEAATRQLAARPIALIEVGYRKMFLKGEGAVSNMEGALTKYLGPQLSDSAKVVQIKAGMISIGADKQEKIVDAFERYKESHPEAGPRSFYQTPEYKRIVDTYETKYRSFADKNGIPLGDIDQTSAKSSGSLVDRLKAERAKRN